MRESCCGGARAISTVVAAIASQILDTIAASQGEGDAKLGGMRTEDIMEALCYVAALHLDVNPNLDTPRRLREASEETGRAVLRHLRTARVHFGESGAHLLEESGTSSRLTEPG